MDQNKENSTGSSGIMNDSLDDFIADYFETSCTTSATSTSSTKNQPISNFDITSDHLFDDSLLLTQLTSNSASSTSNKHDDVVTVQRPHPPESSVGVGSRVVSIRSTRRSLSYDIIFHPGRPISATSSSSQKSEEVDDYSVQQAKTGRGGRRGNTEIAIRIHSHGAGRKIKPGESCAKNSANSARNSANSQVSSSSMSKKSAAAAEGEDLKLKKKMMELEERNKELEKEVKALHEKLGVAQKTIGQLEIEVTNFYAM